MDTGAHSFARMQGENNYQGDCDGIGGLDVDLRVTENGRTTVRSDDDDETLDGMDFSILAGARTLGNMVDPMQAMNTIDVNYTDGTIGSVPSSIVDSRATEQASDRSEDAVVDEKSMQSMTQSSNSESQSPNLQQQQQSQGFQPLLPLPEHPTRQRSAPRAIPNSKPPTTQGIQTQSTGPPVSQPSSAGSTASAFLNNLIDPAASTFNNTQVSRTPPSQIATSYEANHFGKRARSGSVSERLKVSTELEQKGMIDREQKGILKDLIISGQDNELQHALDLYEQGDTALLESMLQGGSLANKVRSDIDLLGDLDLDFLNVNDDGMTEMTSQNIAYVPQATSRINPPPVLPTRGQTHTMASHGTGPGSTPVGASDGIGELDFDGGIGGEDGFGPMNTNYREPSPMYHPGQRSRSNSTFSVDLDYRQRSNSLFSALIGSVTPQEGTPVEYGRWMEREQRAADNQDTNLGVGTTIEKASRRASAPDVRSNLSVTMAADETNISSSQRKELKAEEKRRERQEKKEQREREKREKKEKRDQAKVAKQKKEGPEETEKHEPGSGRPRSMSDPNIITSIDSDGLLNVERPEGWIGAYSPESRKVRIARFLEKRNHRVWTKTVKYDVRKNFADSRLRVKGRFVKKEDELMMRELMSLT